MASEIQVVHSATGATLYAVVRNGSGQCWNTAGTPAFEARTVANWTDYDVALTETPASSYFYIGTFPAAIPAGFYFLDIYTQAGGSPAIADTLAITQSGYWDETAYGQQGTDIRQVAGETASATAEVDFDDLAAVLVGVPTGNPAASFEFEAASATHGSEVSNTYANTALDNGTKHTLAPGSADLDAQYTFNVGDGFPSNISFNGYFDAAPPAGARNVNIYAYNYITSAWNQLSDAATRLNDADADANHMWTLLSSHRKADGEIKVRFYSTSTDTDDRLYVDQLLVNAVVTLGETTEAIAEAVWDHDIENHGVGDHSKAGFYASRSVMDHGNVVSVTGAAVTVDTIQNVAGLYDGCPAQFHDEINDVYEIRRIVTQAADRVLNLDQAPVSTLTTDWDVYIMPDPISLADVLKISGDEAAADALETVLDGTGGAVLKAAQLKLECDIYDEGALHCENVNYDGFGQYNEGGWRGQYNTGAWGQYNEGTDLGQINYGNIAQYNEGIEKGLYNQADIAQHNDGTGLTPQALKLTGPADRIDDILTDTSDLQGNQADWATATGFSTHVPSDVWDVAARTLTAATNLNIPTSDAVAGAVLKTDVSDVEDAACGHSLTTLVLGATESSMSGTTWTIRKTDGTTFATKTVESDASAKPITGVT